MLDDCGEKEDDRLVNEKQLLLFWCVDLPQWRLET